MEQYVKMQYKKITLQQMYFLKTFISLCACGHLIDFSQSRNFISGSFFRMGTSMKLSLTVLA
jgi:hypothetical protein